MTTTTDDMTETIQWSPQRTRVGAMVGGYVFAQAAAEQIRSLGHAAEAHRGPCSIQSPDDEARHGDTVGHVHTTTAGKAAYTAWKAATRRRA